MLAFGSGMRPRTFVFITLLTLCHLQVDGQVLTTALPPSPSEQHATGVRRAIDSLPDDPGQELLPVAQPEPLQSTGVPEVIKADRQTYVNNTWTLSGNVEVHYRGYTLTAEKVTYNKKTTELTADGHIHVSGGQEDISLDTFM